jgi:hypothetical protein
MYEIIIGGGLISLFFLVNFTIGVLGHRENIKYNRRVYSRKIKLRNKKI